MRRIILLTQWFDPEPTLKGLEFAKKLAAGYEVHVVTGFPNYPRGKLYDGYRQKLIQNELRDGIKITRLPLYPSHNRSKVERAITYISFALSSFIYCVFAAPKADVIYCYNPPMTVGLVGILVKFFRRTPVLADIQDLWPDTIVSSGMVRSKFIVKIIDLITTFSYRHFDSIVVQSPGFKSALISRSIPKDKIEVIFNWAPEILGQETETTPFYNQKRDGEFQVMYAGNIGKAQSIETILDAAKLIEQQKKNIRFIIIGDGVQASEMKKRARANQISNVTFEPGVPMKAMPSHLKRADALLVNLKKDPLFKITIPSKTQAYMAAGKPIIMAVEGDARDLIETAGCGICTEPENAHDLAEKIMMLQRLPESSLLQLGKNARSFYDSNLSMTIGAQRFISTIKGLLSDQKNN